MPRRRCSTPYRKACLQSMALLKAATLKEKAPAVGAARSNQNDASAEPKGPRSSAYTTPAEAGVRRRFRPDGRPLGRKPVLVVVEPILPVPKHKLSIRCRDALCHGNEDQKATVHTRLGPARMVPRRM